MRAALGSPLLITQKVSSGQGWRYEIQTVGHPKGSHRRSFTFSAHAFPEPEAFPIHSQDVGMVGQPVQQSAGQLFAAEHPWPMGEVQISGHDE